jgi:SARP family transcriptional regulator, regulator of embCAB operon
MAFAIAFSFGRLRAMVAGRRFPNLSPIFPKLMRMAGANRARIQLCGRFAVKLDGRRVEDALPGAKGRLLFAYLVLNRIRRADRDELLTAVYGEEAMPDHQPRLSVLLSKLRRVVGPELLSGRSEIELVLPPDTFVDVEAAFEAVHRAEFHVANRQWAEAWGPSGVAYHVASRPLLQEHDRPWLNEWRRRLDDIRLRGLECFATARLGLGGPTLPQAEECARRLIELAPYRETGHRILMEALEQRGNAAEALRVYDRLRLLLRDELGVAPSPAVQSVYRRLLGGTTATTA